jgi:hypothetical protein
MITFPVPFTAPDVDPDPLTTCTLTRLPRSSWNFGDGGPGVIVT